MFSPYRGSEVVSALAIPVDVLGVADVVEVLWREWSLEEGNTGGVKLVNMKRVTHQTVHAGLAETTFLPCIFTLRPSPSREPPRIKWTKIVSQGGVKKEISVLVAKDNVIKVKKDFQERVTLPGYPDNRYNATMALTNLHTSDSGIYRCEVVVGIDDEEDTVPLEVEGVVFHYRSPSDRYALTFEDAQRVCLENSAIIATVEQLQAAFDDGYDNCDAGWLSDHTVRYPIRSPRPGCYGDREALPGVRNYGPRDPKELYDVYCYARQQSGDVFHTTTPQKLSLATASTHCHSLGAHLATVGQLYLAWQNGFDRCDPGWLADGSVRYPITQPRRNCGGDTPGVRTVYQHANRTGFPDTTLLFDAYCYRGAPRRAVASAAGLQLSKNSGNSSSANLDQKWTGSTEDQTWQAFSLEQEVQTGSSLQNDLGASSAQRSAILEEQMNAIGSNDSSEISAEHVTFHLRPGLVKLDEDEQLSLASQSSLQSEKLPEGQQEFPVGGQGILPLERQPEPQADESVNLLSTLVSEAEQKDHWDEGHRQQRGFMGDLSGHPTKDQGSLEFGQKVETVNQLPSSAEITNTHAPLNMGALPATSTKYEAAVPTSIASGAAKRHSTSSAETEDPTHEPDIRSEQQPLESNYLMEILEGSNNQAHADNEADGFERRARKGTPEHPPGPPSSLATPKFKDRWSPLEGTSEHRSGGAAGSPPPTPAPETGDETWASEPVAANIRALPPLHVSTKTQTPLETPSSPPESIATWTRLPTLTPLADLTAETSGDDLPTFKEILTLEYHVKGREVRRLSQEETAENFSGEGKEEEESHLGAPEWTSTQAVPQHSELPRLAQLFSETEGSGSREEAGHLVRQEALNSTQGPPAAPMKEDTSLEVYSAVESTSKGVDIVKEAMGTKEPLSVSTQLASIEAHQEEPELTRDLGEVSKQPVITISQDDSVVTEEASPPIDNIIVHQEDPGATVEPGDILSQPATVETNLELHRVTGQPGGVSSQLTTVVAHPENPGVTSEPDEVFTHLIVKEAKPEEAWVTGEPHKDTSQHINIKANQEDTPVTEESLVIGANQEKDGMTGEPINLREDDHKVTEEPPNYWTHLAITVGKQEETETEKPVTVATHQAITNAIQANTLVTDDSLQGWTNHEKDIVTEKPDKVFTHPITIEAHPDDPLVTEESNKELVLPFTIVGKTAPGGTEVTSVTVTENPQDVAEVRGAVDYVPHQTDALPSLGIDLTIISTTTLYGEDMNVTPASTAHLATSMENSSSETEHTLYVVSPSTVVPESKEMLNIDQDSMEHIELSKVQLQEDVSEHPGLQQTEQSMRNESYQEEHSRDQEVRHSGESEMHSPETLDESEQLIQLPMASPSTPPLSPVNASMEHTNVTVGNQPPAEGIEESGGSAAGEETGAGAEPATVEPCGTNPCLHGGTCLSNGTLSSCECQPGYSGENCEIVLCGSPPSVDNAFLIGRKRAHYDIHSTVRYQCADGFLQRHVPTVKCRSNGKWDRPKIICSKCEHSGDSA
ncbi:NCAN protein, partial [Polypterus senegalus]